jgi:secreted Zn-dependent insulinase-like peptidase
MSEVRIPLPRYGESRRGVRAVDVAQAADALLRVGERPTIEKVRARLGSGSPNTINPLLDLWWKKIGARLETKGPAALERLPELVAHVAEALWLQALQEAQQRAKRELSSQEQKNADHQQAIELKTHVLTLREGEMASRLADRDKRIAELELTLRETVLNLRKQEATSDSLSRQLVAATEDFRNLAARQQLLLTKRPRTIRAPRPATKKPSRARTKQAVRKKRKR